jgi:integrase
MNPKGNICVVEPIRDLKKLNDMKELLLERNERDYLMFVLGINSGLRISDILRLTVEDVQNGYVTIREKKTQKTKQFALSDTCKKAIRQYLKNSGITTGTLFPSRKDSDQPITEKSAWRILKDAAEWCGIQENIGTHSLRKTFGWHAYRSGVDIGYLQSCFNHSSQAVTMRYLGITQDELNEKVYRNMNL